MTNFFAIWCLPGKVTENWGPGRVQPDRPGRPPPPASANDYATWRRIRPLFMRKTTSILGRMLKSCVAMITQYPYE